jgi:hypothetical protein
VCACVCVNSLKFISFNRELLAAGCRKHTKEPIHNALTELESKEDKIAQNMFKNVMGFMGDRAYPDPIQLAQEILKLCLEPTNAWLRPEIYCQIIKQVTSNPSQYVPPLPFIRASVAAPLTRSFGVWWCGVVWWWWCRDSLNKGWQLMAVCLETFPPGEFENYLETWLRSNAKPPERYIRLLHGTVYGGPQKSTPSIVDIQKIMNGGVCARALCSAPLCPLPSLLLPFRLSPSDSHTSSFCVQTLSKINWEEKTDYKAPVAALPARKGPSNGAPEEPQQKTQPPLKSYGSRMSTTAAGGAPPPPPDDGPPPPPVTHYPITSPSSPCACVCCTTSLVVVLCCFVV